MATQTKISRGNPRCSNVEHTRVFIGTDGFERCKDCRREYFRRWINDPVNKARHEVKQQARHKANKNKSKIKRDYCESCGSSLSLHMHHNDYGKPLEVVTLCVTCHEAVHHKLGGVFANAPNQSP